MANVLEIIVKAKDEASKQLGHVGTSVQKMSGQLKIAGAAMLAVGVAGLKMASDARKMNADLGYTGMIIGATTAEMREMALAITDVTFGIKSVTATFEALARSGVRDTEVMKQNALAFDALADATKSSAETVAGVLIPAYKTFGEELPTTAAEMDKWTYLITTTNVELTELGSLMGYIATYGRDLNLTTEDLVLMMKALAEAGLSASDGARLLRTGINQAEGSVEKLFDILGITREELEKYSAEMENTTDLTKDLQKQQESQFTVLDKLKQKFHELELRLAPVLIALEPVFSVMTALGPAMLTLVFVMPKLLTAFTALKIKMAAVQVQAHAMWAAITLGISLVIAGIIALLIHWDDVVAFFKGPAYRATKDLESAMADLADMMMTDIKEGAREATSAMKSLIEFLQTGRYEQVEFMTDEQLALIREVNPELADQIQAAQDLAKTQGEIADTLERQLEAGKDAIRLTEIAEQLLTAEGKERDALLAEQARLQEKVYVEDWKGIVRENSDIIVGALEDQLKEWDTYFDLIDKGWDGTLEHLENEIIPAWNALIAEGFVVPEQGQELLDIYNETLDKLEEILGKEEEFRERAQYPFDYWRWSGAPSPLTGIQYGGIVTRPTAALIGEAGPEAVIPLPQMQPGEININVGYLMGDEASLRKFARHLKQVLGEEGRRSQFGQVQSGYYFGRSSI